MQAVKFSLPTLSLAGWQQGPETQQVTLCLHGWLDNADSFFTSLRSPYRIEFGFD